MRNLRGTQENLDQYHKLWHAKLYELRAHLEAFAARNAAARVAAGASPHKLKQRVQEMRAAAKQGDYAAFVNADMSFHRAIAELAEVPALVDMWDLLEEKIRGFVDWGHRHIFRDLESLIAQHEAILDTIRSGQPKAAERIVQVTLDPLWQIFADQPANRERESDPVDLVYSHILLNLHQRLTLTTLARDVAHVSPSHLAKLFRERHGEAVTSCIRELRLRRAAALLHDSDWPVHEIAERLGYADPSRFAAHFRRRFRCSPQEWRQKERAISPIRKRESA